MLHTMPPTATKLPAKIAASIATDGDFFATKGRGAAALAGKGSALDVDAGCPSAPGGAIGGNDWNGS